MANLAGTLKILHKERSRAATQLGQLDQAIAVLGQLVGRNHSGTGTRKRRKMSVAARNRIAAAQRARWAKWKAKQEKKAA